jgi:hypothetical protein
VTPIPIKWTGSAWQPCHSGGVIKDGEEEDDNDSDLMAAIMASLQITDNENNTTTTTTVDDENTTTASSTTASSNTTASCGSTTAFTHNEKIESRLHQEWNDREIQLAIENSYRVPPSSDNLANKVGDDDDDTEEYDDPLNDPELTAEERENMRRAMAEDRLGAFREEWVGQLACKNNNNTENTMTSPCAPHPYSLQLHRDRVTES